ncbi:cadherin domain-containing protein [Rhizobium sp. XQZ8]|nr:cadherin domain-containing protein [Rhizobium populisoli]
MVTTKPLDYETLKTDTVTVAVSDGTNATKQTFTIGVTNVNEAPSSLTLSASAVAENQKVGTTVGTFAAVDPEGGKLTYKLLDGAAGLFKLDGNKLLTAKTIDYEKIQKDTVQIEISDGTNKVTKVFAISVVDVAETIKGSNKSETITGGIGADTIDALDGDDKLYGGSGNDVLKGGLGKDFLVGGAGRDSFVFNTKLGSANIDTINDFSAKDDSIWLSDDVFTNVGKVGDLKPDALYIGTKAHDTSDRVIYDKASGKLWYDADGNGKGAAIQFAQIDKGLLLTAAHFDVLA